MVLLLAVAITFFSVSSGEKTIDNMCTGHASVCYMLHIISVSISVQHINKGSWFIKCVIVYHEKLSIKHPEIQVYYYYYCYLNIFAVNGKINE